MVHDLNNQGISAVNLHQGTFDIYVERGLESVWCGLMEVKKLGKWNPAYHTPTIQFGDDQTKAMRQMKNQPFVVIFGEEPERYYLLTPEAVSKKVKSPGRKKWLELGRPIWITEDRDHRGRGLNIPEIPCFSSYEALLKAIMEYLK